MTKQEIFNEMDDCLKTGNISCFNKQLDQLFETMEGKDATVAFTEFVFQRFTTYKADTMARLMQELIKKHPDAAQKNHPQNPLFKLACTLGSKDLFDCYIEDSVLPFLADKDGDYKAEYYAELYETAERLNEIIFPSYESCIKGTHFNGGFRQEKNSNLLSINIEDFEVMDQIVEHFNAIVGRRDISKFLEEKSYL